MCIVHKDFKSSRVSSPASILMYNLIGSKPAIPYAPDTHLTSHRVKPIAIMGKFKMQTSKQINILHNAPGTKTRQHNYHDHIIRNNPLNWKKDSFFV